MIYIPEDDPRSQLAKVDELLGVKTRQQREARLTEALRELARVDEMLESSDADTREWAIQELRQKKFCPINGGVDVPIPECPNGDACTCTWHQWPILYAGDSGEKESGTDGK